MVWGPSYLLAIYKGRALKPLQNILDGMFLLAGLVLLPLPAICAQTIATDSVEAVKAFDDPWPPSGFPEERMDSWGDRGPRARGEINDTATG